MGFCLLIINLKKIISNCRIIRSLFLLLIILFAESSFAAGGLFSSSSVDFSKVFDFDPNNSAALYDVSLHYLGQIFGPILDTGHIAADNTIIAQYMRWFNYGVISFVGGVVATTVATSVVNSSREGVFMGQMIQNAWYPIRIALGVGFLAPTVNGYSGIQVLILWAAVQGVGLANTIWGVTTDYVKNHGGAFKSGLGVVQVAQSSAGDVDNGLADNYNKADYKQSLNLGVNILRMQNCIAFNTSTITI